MTKLILAYRNFANAPNEALHNMPTLPRILQDSTITSEICGMWYVSCDGLK
jgi:hypothetical protein